MTEYDFAKLLNKYVTFEITGFIEGSGDVGEIKVRPFDKAYNWVATDLIDTATIKIHNDDVLQRLKDDAKEKSRLSRINEIKEAIFELSAELQELSKARGDMGVADD